MPQQFDIEAGFDPTPLSALSAAQILQMVNQAKPLANIGGVLYFTTPPTQTEVETDNPRWIRYFGLHFTGSQSPIPKLWNQTTKVWDTITVGASSINNSQINGFAVSVLSNLTRAADDSPDATKAKFILRLDSSGKHVEIVSIDTILDEEKVDADQLNVTGVSDNQIIVKRSGNPVWASFDAALDVVNGGIPLAKLATSGNNLLMATDGSGVLQLMTVANAIISASLRLDKLGNSYDDVAPTDGQVVTFRPAGKKWETPKFSLELQGIDVSSASHKISGTEAVSGGLPTLNNYIHYEVSHNLGTRPKQVRVVMKCLTAEHGYAIDDEVDLYSIRYEGGASDKQDLGVCVVSRTDKVSITAGIFSGGAPKIFNRTTGADSTLTLASWRFKVYAWA